MGRRVLRMELVDERRGFTDEDVGGRAGGWGDRMEQDA